MGPAGGPSSKSKDGAVIVTWMFRRYNAGTYFKRIFLFNSTFSELLYKSIIHSTGIWHSVTKTTANLKSSIRRAFVRCTQRFHWSLAECDRNEAADSEPKGWGYFIFFFLYKVNENAKKKYLFWCSSQLVINYDFSPILKVKKKLDFCLVLDRVNRSNTNLKTCFDC